MIEKVKGEEETSIPFRGCWAMIISLTRKQCQRCCVFQFLMKWDHEMNEIICLCSFIHAFARFQWSTAQILAVWYLTYISFVQWCVYTLFLGSSATSVTFLYLLIGSSQILWLWSPVDGAGWCRHTHTDELQYRPLWEQSFLPFGNLRTIILHTCRKLGAVDLSVRVYWCSFGSICWNFFCAKYQI